MPISLGFILGVVIVMMIMFEIEPIGLKERAFALSE